MNLEQVRLSHLSDNLPLFLGLPLEVRIISMETLISIDRTVMAVPQASGSPGRSLLANTNLLKTCRTGVDTRRIIGLKLSNDWKVCGFVKLSIDVTGHGSDAQSLLEGLGKVWARSLLRYKCDLYAPSPRTSMRNFPSCWQRHVVEMAINYQPVQV